MIHGLRILFSSGWIGLRLFDLLLLTGSLSIPRGLHEQTPWWKCQFMAESRDTQQISSANLSIKILQVTTWERLSKINPETFHCSKGMPNFSQFQTQRSQSIQLMPAEKKIIRWYDLLICVPYETYDSRIISNYV
jgi:hypothetical protein